MFGPLMPLRLQVIPPASRNPNEMHAGERTVEFGDAIAQIRIGRRADLELSLPFPRLSGVHARIVRSNDGDQNGGHWLLEDLGSTNGTFVGDERLKPGIKCLLQAGTQLRFAEVRVIFGAPASGDASGKVQAEAPRRDTDRVTGKVQLEAPTRDTGRVTGKVQAEAPARDTGKVTGKIQLEPPVKAPVKAPQEPPGKDPGRITGKQQAEAPSKSSPRAEDASPVRPAVADPTQTYVRGRQSEAAAPAVVLEQVPYLTVVGGIDGSPRSFRLEERDHVYMFGRTRRCEFRVDTAEVSREHASFSRRPDGIFVNDLGSVNGVLVNNTRVKEYRLYHGDLIQIGHIKLRLFDPDEPSPRESAADRSPLSRGTPSRSMPSHATPSQSAPSHGAASHAAFGARHDPKPYAPPPPAHAEASSTYGGELHPAIAAELAQEGIGEGYRPRRQSVRVRLGQTWEKSSKFRYAIVIVAATLLAFVAVTIGFQLAG